MSNKVLTVWFDVKGNLLDHAPHKRYASHLNYLSEEASDFDDRLTYVEIAAWGGKAARVYLKSTRTGRQFSMFMDDFHNIIIAQRFNNNQIEGTFHFVKKGNAQAIKLLLPKISMVADAT